MNNTPVVEYLLTIKILLYELYIVDGNSIGEFAIRTGQKYEKTAKLIAKTFKYVM